MSHYPEYSIFVSHTSTLKSTTRMSICRRLFVPYEISTTGTFAF
jgi:hypothetical protein